MAIEPKQTFLNYFLNKCAEHKELGKYAEGALHVMSSASIKADKVFYASKGLMKMDANGSINYSGIPDARIIGSQVSLNATESLVLEGVIRRPLGICATEVLSLCAPEIKLKNIFIFVMSKTKIALHGKEFIFENAYICLVKIIDGQTKVVSTSPFIDPRIVEARMKENQAHETLLSLRYS